MEKMHEIILFVGALGLIGIFTGLFSARYGTPLLLVFLALGVLAGKDGIGIQFERYDIAYLIGSIALAIILFEGGLKTRSSMIKAAGWPALVLATVGVVITASIVGAAAVWFFALPWQQALLIGAVLAPTDAAAIAMSLRRTSLNLPERVKGVLEIESGLNDPMSVFLTILLVQLIHSPEEFTTTNALLLFAGQMGGGILLGAAGGYIFRRILCRLKVEPALYSAIAVVGALFLFGSAQSVGASGFLAVYLMGAIIAAHDSAINRAVGVFVDVLAWLAQLALFLLLGILVTPHDLVPILVPAIGIVFVLILVGRPISAFICLMPFRFSARETTFISWVGLRGAVPIYLTIIPVLEGTYKSIVLFGATFMIVILSVIVQGWTITPAARLLRLEDMREKNNL